MIEVGGVCKRYGDVVAVEGLDLTVQRGERVALVGPSGCGKTTALRLIAGFEHPDKGVVRIGGAVVSSRTDFAPAHERGLGYVPQSAGLFPSMDVARNVAYGLYRLDRRERARRVDDVLEAFGLSDLRHRGTHELSGGQARRVALARALAPGPARLLLDEPLTNLDVRSRDELLCRIDQSVTASGASLLYVTHDPSEAQRLGARIVAMG